ncbi:hypothetical protein GCM10010989_09100 [Croceicoccus pelagius]|uniref:DUF465 domain-containing protein n=2 Tax=Croceicoccus pelagius TaxID=1703341 RepID=A0A916YAT1_9SPHN|nr:hypothetical protein GCM10010989_09100 [Croceicoccus pelagius]
MRAAAARAKERSPARERVVRTTILEGSARMTEDEMRKRLEILKVEHRDLDAAIAALAENASAQLQVARLKKRKLVLKDQIAMIRDALIPDIIA